MGLLGGNFVFGNVEFECAGAVGCEEVVVACVDAAKFVVDRNGGDVVSLKLMISTL